MVDVLVLDEADRMIADGHFKEMRDILAHIYTTRLQIKTSKKHVKLPKGVRPDAEIIEVKEDLQDAIRDSKQFFMGKNLEAGNKDANLDWGEVKDLVDEDAMFEQMRQEGNIILDQKSDAKEGDP